MDPFCNNIPPADVARLLSPVSGEQVVLELKFERRFCLPLVERTREGGNIPFAKGIFLRVHVPLWGTDSHLLGVCGACAHDDTVEECVFRDLGSIGPCGIAAFWPRSSCCASGLETDRPAVDLSPPLLLSGSPAQCNPDICIPGR